MANGYVGIPTSYTPVEYIESSGTQYIDTGVAGTYSTARFEIEFALTQTVSNTEQTFIGDKNGSGSGTTIFSQSANNLNLYTWSGSGTSYQIGTMVLNAKNILDLTFTSPSGRSGTFNSTNFSSSTSNNATSNSESFAIFSSKPNVLDTPAYAKLYSLKIHINGTLVRNYLPILDNNNVACLYDLVEGKFYYNAGSGAFAAGSTTGQPVSIGDKARKLKKGYVGIPASYTPVEYIESTGTQYINTGVVMTSNVSAEIDFQLTTITSAAHNSIITSFVDGTQKGFVFAQRSNNSNFAYAFGAGWNGTEVAANLTRHIAQVNLNGKCYLDNQILVSTAGSAGLNSNLNILLCAWHESGGTNRFGYLKIYSCKIWDGNTLARDFIPALDSNNVPCLYDQVEGKFYYNAGSGAFSYGSAGQPVSLGDVARKIIRGYVGVNGVAKLCFGSLIPRYSTTITNTVHKNVPAVANTTDYIIIAGGQTTDSSNPVKTVTAYSSSLVATQAADMPTQSNYQGACGFNGYAIIASGKTATSGNSRTNQVLAYSNNLTVSSLPTLTNSVYEPTAEGNDVHFVVQGGTYYSGNSYYITSYDTNFVKSTPATMTNVRRNHSSAAVGNYIVCCGCFTTQAATDFYDNTNVKTTATSPYNKVNCNPLGLSTNNYAIFFGGSTSQNMTNAYTDCKAYDKNKVLISFNLPKVAYGAQGFSTGDYAFVGYTYDSYVYDDDLVLVEHITHDTNIYGTSVGTQGAATDSFAIIHHDWSTSIRVLTV